MFTANHERYLMTRLRHVDESLAEALQRLEPPADGQLSNRLIADATLEQRLVLRDYLAQLRFAMRRFVQAHQMTDPSTPVSGLKSFGVAVTFAQIAVEELRPPYLRGYGAVEATAAEAVERLTAEMQTLLRRMSGYLARGDDDGLSGRLARLERTPEEAALLQELDRIISAYGLVELALPLRMLIDRVVAPRFEIAILGRVSTGKSSLLNWWLERPVLPTGVTPVTSVPTRIVHGEPARAVVTTALAKSSVLPLEDASRYITEASNPGNREGVLEMVLHLPAPRLKSGLVLVDTPGLGSLATFGASQTLEYLPRCDLGILLIEAGAAATREDLDVARALLDAGSELMVALSKVDRLSGVELSQAVAYSAEQFRTVLGMPVDIGRISTLDSHSMLAAQWLDQSLSPRIAHVRARAATSLKRKIGVLRENVMAVLDARLQASTRPVPPSPSQSTLISEVLPAARSHIRRTREDMLALTGNVSKCVGDLLDTAGRTLESCWNDGSEEAATFADNIEVAFAKLAGQIGDIVTEPLTRLRGELQRILVQRGAAAVVEELPAPRGRPIFDSAFVARCAHIGPPHGIRALRPFAKASARRAVERAFRKLIEEQLSLYSQALRVWSLLYLDELSSRFDATVAAEEGSARLSSGEEGGEFSNERAQEDLARLREWPRGGAATDVTG